jgi:predicted Zn-dependent peptidase
MRSQGPYVTPPLQQAEPTVNVDVDQLLDQKLEQMPGMTLGQLDNGLRYVILPNKVPPNRFEAHLEMHVGEELPRAGMAHVCSGTLSTKE